MMNDLDRRIVAKMEFVLDEIFEGVPHGGDHESRKYVAEMLLKRVKKENVTLDELRTAGRDASQQLSTRGRLGLSDLPGNPVSSIRFGSYR
jgi:hypothetical protein